MSIRTVIFLGKSKKKTGNTRFMLKALQRRVEKVVFLNLPRVKKYYFWSDHRKIIHQKIIRHNPDLVLIYSKDIPHSVLQKISTRYKTAIFFPDPDGPSDQKLIRYGALVDYLFLTNKTHLADLKSQGVKNPVYCMQGCDRDAHRIISTRDKKWAAEVAFVGRPWQENRVKILKAIDAKYQLKTWGARWQDYGLTCLKTRVYPAEYAKICYATKIILGCDQSFELEGYFSNRTWITLGCGGFLLTNYNPGLEDIFTKGQHLEWYHDEAECLELIDYYLKHEDRRKQIAQNGYEFAHTHRTYDNVIEDIISHVEGRHRSG
jgi:spore maturation protein CgeB